jgi:alkanesulfonate monooxygenase SsuD/methylene tetrahydromethanopterin reductase-like flavin-dependent oxidoreductase (luciferase family)
MRIGMSLASAHNVQDPREGARNMIERAAAASDAGLDSLFVGDHHVTPAPYYQNVAILGRMLAEWRGRTAGALFLLPMWNPVLLAEQIATLASIHDGPFVMQCGLGYGEEQFAGMGTTQRVRPSAFEQSLDILRRLWAGEEVSSDGRFKFQGARISPLPPEPIDVWIGASAEVSMDRAARIGEAWLGAPALTFEQAKTNIDYYRERSEAHGRDPSVIPIRRDVYIGSSDGEAAETTERVVGGGYRGFDPDALVVGGVETAAQRFGELAEMGYTDVIVRNAMPDQPSALGTIERLGRVREMIAEL